jgi:hypothetical protein
MGRAISTLAVTGADMGLPVEWVTLSGAIE